MNSPMPEWIPRRLMTVREAAHLLRQSERQTWRDIAAGDLRVVRLGRSIRITPEAFAARIANSD